MRQSWDLKTIVEFQNLSIKPLCSVCGLSQLSTPCMSSALHLSKLRLLCYIWKFLCHTLQWFPYLCSCRFLAFQVTAVLLRKLQGKLNDAHSWDLLWLTGTCVHQANNSILYFQNHSLSNFLSLNSISNRKLHVLSFCLGVQQSE